MMYVTIINECGVGFWYSDGGGKTKGARDTSEMSGMGSGRSAGRDNGNGR
jgi:hypothetical protein